MELLGIPGAVLVQGSAAGALIFVVLAIVTGRLVPRRSLEDVREDRDKRLGEANARGDEWRAAYQAENARNDLQGKHIEQLLEMSRTTNALLESLKRASDQRSGRRP